MITNTTTAAAQVFDFKGTQVRTAQNDKGEPMFIAKDVCEVLGISDHRQAVDALDDDEKGTGYNVPTPSGPQNMIAVTESGLYTLIFKSRKAEAKAFRKWITAEVIPAIRKTGSYSAPSARRAIAPAVINNTRAILAIARDLPRIFPGVRRDILAAQTLRAIEDNGDLNTEALRLALPVPKDEEIEQLNATQVGKLCGLTAREVNERLISLGYQRKQPKGGYEVTGAGYVYGSMFPFVRNGHSGLEARWKASVANVLQDRIRFAD